MIGRILKSTAGKPCSCPDGKICEGCKKKKFVKPQVYIEEPRRLTVPIIISRYNNKPSTTVQVVGKPKSWFIRKKQPVKKTLCQWYKRRKALNELKNDYQKEKKREKEERLERAKREREIEVLEQLRLQAAERTVIDKTVEKQQKEIQREKRKRAKREREIEILEQLRLQSTDRPVEKTVVKKQKPKRVKARTATAKPRADSKFVSVKRVNRYESLSDRFVNFCYKVCCQFYCYLSCIFIVGFIIVYFL